MPLASLVRQKKITEINKSYSPCQKWDSKSIPSEHQWYVDRQLLMFALVIDVTLKQDPVLRVILRYREIHICMLV